MAAFPKIERLNVVLELGVDTRYVIRLLKIVSEAHASVALQIRLNGANGFVQARVT